MQFRNEEMPKKTSTPFLFRSRRIFHMAEFGIQPLSVTPFLNSWHTGYRPFN